MLILFNYRDLAACVISNEDIKATLFLFYKANTENGCVILWTYTNAFRSTEESVLKCAWVC